ncbi:MULTISPECIES: sensor histidine kinase [Streptomyces]|uniref:Signal transduction histidine-protein kinase/phosphatase MprB n=1 Tax=Streptomyces canarius TaxID=285453 RepID=A0ABQ3DBY8_9ACTN|nr:HAMP domain-containing sensor histidine kinase [Streptomyces canarius]GHA71854.1 two-component sensor histidine kinase [Streptomyces canarius]
MDTLRTMLNWRSLRWRIALLVTVACCAVALTVGVMVHRSTLARSLNDNASRARTALSTAQAAYERTGSLSVGDVTDPARMPNTLLHRLKHRPDAVGVVTWYQKDAYHPAMWAAGSYQGAPFAVSVDMTADLLTRQALDRHIWKYSLAVLAVVVPLSALAAELPNRRLRQVARTAHRISEGDLTARTAAAGGGDEVSSIAASVDAMADSLHDRLVAEQRFTADVAHELRTPLMGLVTAAGLLPDCEATDLVRDRATVLRDLVEELLEISRLDAGAETADARPVPLAEVVRDCLARTGLDVRLTAHGEQWADTEPRRLDRIVANLVTNAHRHGRAPVEVEVRGTTVTVRDHGPGLPADLLAHGPQRFRTGAAERGRGHGLGLTIALGQARVLGAELDLADAPGGGALAVLRLPAAPTAQSAPEPPIPG